MQLKEHYISNYKYYENNILMTIMFVFRKIYKEQQ